ncbi:MAG: hypothetical protein ACE5I2_16075 [Anaerolineae bacterium]
MSWRDYERLIRERNADPAAWLSAEEGNPNTPEDALRLAIRESDPADVEATRVALQQAKDRLYAHAAREADYGNWEPTAQYQALRGALEVFTELDLTDDQPDGTSRPHAWPTDVVGTFKESLHDYDPGPDGGSAF